MKIKIVAIIMSIMIIFMYVPVYAQTELPGMPSVVYPYWVYFIDTAGPVIYFGTSYNPITVEDENGWKINVRGIYYTYVNNQWVYYGEADSVYNPGFIIAAANHDIAYEDGSGFFFVPPKVSPLIQTMEVTDFGRILRNFSGGLIPILGLIVSCMAFRKAWQFLRSQLQS